MGFEKAALAWVAGVALASGACGAAQELQVIPAPAEVVRHDGALAIPAMTQVCVAGGSHEADFAARYLMQITTETNGLRLVPGVCKQPSARPVVALRLDENSALPKEGYILDVDATGVRVTAKDRPGLFYGVVTLWAMLTATSDRHEVQLPFVHVEDAPRFAWRGIMLDSARHFQSVAFIQKLIDQMGLHKLNVLHWHLTDDQGWRIEIKRYPRLTQVGAWSVPAGPAAAADIDPKTKRPRVYGGYYTQAQVRALVSYAAERNITIVPEIDMPGHSTAAIAAYPMLAASPKPPVAPSNQWGVHDNIYNLDEATFSFLDNVLAEVMDLFPSEYIHIGGDEAQKAQWKASATIQAKMRALGISSEDALQSYFVRRIEGYLNSRGRKLIGWDEILQGGLAPNAAVMSWHGVEGGMTAAKAGHVAVLCPQRPLYFNFRQSDATDEPPGRAPLNTLKEVYDFDPAPSSQVPAEARKYILGLQANLWTEHVRTEDRVEHMLFPRAAALAEVGWSPEKRDWDSFLARMVTQFARYRALGLPAAESAFEVRVAGSITTKPGEANVSLSNQAKFGEIHYTLDGTAATIQSMVYVDQLTIELPKTIRAATFYRGREVTSPVQERLDPLTVRRRDSRQLELCTANPALQMEDDAPIRGKRAVFLVNYLDPCWVYRDANLDDIGSIEASVGQIPFNLKTDAKPVLHEPRTPAGELQVFVGECKGEPLVTLSLEPARANNGTTTLRANMPAISGTHNLCFNFTRAKNDYIWAVEQVQLVPKSK